MERIIQNLGTSPVVFIPARGGSKGVPRKNLQPVGGIPLVQRAILAARAASEVLEREIRIFVSTEDEEIASCAREIGFAQIHERPSSLAKDSSVLEEALIHFFREDLHGSSMDGQTPVAVLQCTSPFTRPTDIALGLNMVSNGSCDSAFIGLKNHYWLYSEVEPSDWQPLMHRLGSRPPRQQLAPQAHEIGAGYFFKASGLLTNNFRLHGRIGLVEADLLSSIDIDDLDDLHFCQEIAKTLKPDEVRRHMR